MLYPLKFEPILKSVIWGGKRICRYKNIYPLLDKIGESWEISGLKENISIVNNGFLSGNPLNELIKIYKEKLLGKFIYENVGAIFPLLVKFIDAKQSLSVQVHPNDIIARERHNSFGKTEMWYIIKASKGAFLYSGFQKKMNAQKYLQILKKNTFIDSLKKYIVKSGDVFFIPAGCVHAIGAGCFIVEVHQTSNITYRIYDYNRKDLNGNLRQLHTELAKDTINYKAFYSYQQKFLLQKQKTNNILINCSFFTIKKIENRKNSQIWTRHIDRFVIYICLQGKVHFLDKLNNTIDLKRGETVLIPANNSEIICLTFKEKSILLEIYIRNV
ncbi:MAG: class I mannose-6-phosphate isomerase [Bacteroidales bacterium OttesenSCG-928-I14]|jgi:mannose-6-phosphate isomerase|nr:class I mannose-6-phosphate isomerase [Bacteroidales bacterium OttesenSCG-928-I14]